MRLLDVMPDVVPSFIFAPESICSRYAESIHSAVQSRQPTAGVLAVRQSVAHWRIAMRTYAPLLQPMCPILAMHRTKANTFTNRYAESEGSAFDEDDSDAEAPRSSRHLETCTAHSA